MPYGLYMIEGSKGYVGLFSCLFVCLWADGLICSLHALWGLDNDGVELI